MAETPITITCDQLTELIRPVIHQNLKAGQEAQADISQLPDDSTEQLLSSLQQHLTAYIQGSKSLQTKGVPLPEVDEQLLPLQQQVESVMQSVAAHRTSVPAVISKALEQQLQAMRPPGCAADDDAQAHTDQATAAAAAAGTLNVPEAAGDEVAQAQQLQEALKAALNKLPALRARLEEMDGRLQRNLEAVDAAQAAAEQAPRTVERVLRSVAAGGKGRRVAAAPAAAAAAAASSQDE